MSFDLISFLIGLSTTSTLLFICKNWFIERLKQSINHEYSVKISYLNSELALKNESQIKQINSLLELQSLTLKQVNESYNLHYAKVSERKLDALEKTWDTFLRLSRESPGVIIGLVDILTVDESEWLFRRDKYQNIANSKDHEALTSEFLEFTYPIENLRIYIGDNLWELLFIFRAIIIRTHYLIVASCEDSSKAFAWHLDNVILQHLNRLLSEKEKEIFNSKLFGKFAYVQSLIISKVLIEINEIISGKRASEDMLQQATSTQQYFLKPNI